MKECIIELVNTSYSYNHETMVLKDINIKIHKGEKIAILGNNGAGKSTFFLLLNGVLHSHQGKILLHGKEISHNKKDLTLLRKEVGFVFQDPDNQIIAPTVESEISFGLININLSKDVIKDRITKSMEELNLTRYKKSPPHYLSGGEKKRVTIADILVMEPKVILFDEPTSSLDGINTFVFEDILKRQMEKGMTALISTHDLNFVWRWASRVIVFHQGEIVGDDTPENIFKNDSLLKRTSLNKPEMLRTVEIINSIHGMDYPTTPPRNEEMFKEYLKTIYDKSINNN